MSSNILLISTTEYTVKDVISNFKKYKQEASQTKNENPISNEPDKDVALNQLTSLDKSRYSSRTETEDTVISQTKTRSISSVSLYDEIRKNKNQKK